MKLFDKTVRRIKLILIFSVLPVLLSSQSLNPKSLYPTTNKGEIVNHTFYSLSYVEEYEQPEWVAYVFNSQNEIKRTSRKDNFREDPLVNTGSATLSDYKGSGYDRGHLVPAGSIAFDELAMSESFFMSNMSPQNPSHLVQASRLDIF